MESHSNLSAKCVISNANVNQARTFVIIDAKLYVPAVTLSIQDNAKLLEQLKLGSKHTINCHKYHSKAEPLNTSNSYLDSLTNPSFQGVNYFTI